MQKILYVLAVAGLIGVGWFAGILLNTFDNRFSTVLRASSDPVRVNAVSQLTEAENVESPVIVATTSILVPEDGWVIGIRRTIHGAPEQRAHTMQVRDSSHHDPVCKSESNRVIFHMSPETSPELTFPPGYGYYVKKGTELEVVGSFSAAAEESFDSVSFDAFVRFVPRSGGAVLKEIYPVFVDAPCLSSENADQLRSERATKHISFTSPYDGSIVFLSTHSDAHTQEMELTLNKTTLWKTSPILLPDGTRAGNPIYRAQYRGVPIQKGDVLQLNAVFENRSDARSQFLPSLYLFLIPATDVFAPGL